MQQLWNEQGSLTSCVRRCSLGQISDVAYTVGKGCLGWAVGDEGGDREMVGGYCSRQPKTLHQME